MSFNINSPIAGLATILAFLFTVSAGPARAQSIEWRGFGYLYGFSEECAAKGYSAPQPVLVRFRPSGLGSNGDRTSLSIFFQTYAIGFAVDGGRFLFRWQPVTAGSVGGSV